MKKTNVVLGLLAFSLIGSLAHASPGDAEIGLQMQQPGGLAGFYHLTNDGERCKKNIEVKVELDGDSSKENPFYEVIVKNSDIPGAQGLSSEVNWLMAVNLSTSRKGGNDIDTEYFERSATPTSISNSWKDKTFFMGPSKEASLKLSGKGDAEILTYHFQSSFWPKDDTTLNYDIKCVYKRN